MLLILGIVILLTSPVGNWLGSIVRELSVHHEVKLGFGGGKSTFDNNATKTGSSGGGGGSGGFSSSPQLFNVPIMDASGGMGTIQVLAHDASAALGNASQGGNTPVGSAQLA